MPTAYDRPSEGGSLLPWLPIGVAVAHILPKIDGNYGPPYFLYDYRHGFAKRALLGTLFSHVHYLTRGDVLLIQGAILLATIWVTYAVFRQPLFRDRAMTPLTVMLLCGPALLPHLFLMFIPTDPLLFMLAVFGLWSFLKVRAPIAVALTLVAGVIALLLHEAFAVRFYPLFIAIMIELCRRGKLRWSMAAAHVGVMLISFGLIFHFGTLTYPWRMFAAEAQARAGFLVYAQVFNLMHESTGEAIRESMGFVLHRGVLQVFALSVLLALPYLASVVILLRRTMRAAEFPLSQQFVTVLLFCAPLILIPLTTDWLRWLSDCMICATLFILYLYSADGEEGAVRTFLRSFAGTQTTTALIGYACAIGPFAGMWLESANFISHGYYDRIVY